ncbi:hypothetical protein DyAD56_14545 [Dyella sp. AD56]|uniref:hypothetical protein n=1 Tax=Dyella sp. AD56 TaxID=1528744 RepID=UPI000C837BB6|nr:hypothetical protein [Dyella sp. AD56]PMQ04477.1 hypothetical protein DyAD56_14545 [Dyella sp. AD56]
MTPEGQRPPRVVAIGLRAHKGGAVAVCVAVENGVPQVVLSTVLVTGAESDRLSFEPYRVAAEMPRGPEGKASADAIAAVEEGRRRQDAAATKGLQAMLSDMAAAGYATVVVALLVNRAGWVTDLLAYSLEWAEHVPVAEALAVRDALRSACSGCGIERVELDEKSLPELAASELGVSSVDISDRLKTLGMSRWKPWRKEQKLACLAAWLAAGRRPPGG